MPSYYIDEAEIAKLIDELASNINIYDYVNESGARELIKKILEPEEFKIPSHMFYDIEPDFPFGTYWGTLSQLDEMTPDSDVVIQSLDGEYMTSIDAESALGSTWVYFENMSSTGLVPGMNTCYLGFMRVADNDITGISAGIYPAVVNLVFKDKSLLASYINVPSVSSSGQGIQVLEECDFLTLEDGVYILGKNDDSYVYDHEGYDRVTQATIDFKNGPYYFTTNMSGYNLVDTRRLSPRTGSIIFVNGDVVKIIGNYDFSIGSALKWSEHESLGSECITGSRWGDNVYWNYDYISTEFAESGRFLPDVPYESNKYLNGNKQWVEIDVPEIDVATVDETIEYLS